METQEILTEDSASNKDQQLLVLNKSVNVCEKKKKGMTSIDIHDDLCDGSVAVAITLESVKNEWKAYVFMDTSSTECVCAHSFAHRHTSISYPMKKRMMNYAIRLFKFIKARTKFLIRCYAI